MLNNDQVLGNGTIDRTYSLVSIAGEKSIRRDPTSSIAEPKYLTVSYTDRVPSDPTSPSRHLVRIDHTETNATSGKPETLSLYCVLERPKTATFSDAEVSAMKTELINFLQGSSSAFFVKWLNREP